MTRYGPQSCPSTRRGAPGRGGYPVDAQAVEVASLDPMTGSTPAISRHDAHRPSGASGGSSRPHRGHRRDGWWIVSDITSLVRLFRRRGEAAKGGYLDQTEPSPEVTRSTLE